MSKSLGNFFTVRDILKEYEPEDARMLMLSAHYRSPLNFSRDMMAQAHASLTRLYTARDRIASLQNAAKVKEASQADKDLIAQAAEIEARFMAGMDNDFNTAEAMGALFELVYAANTALDADNSRQAAEAVWASMKRMTDIFGLLLKQADDVPGEVKELAAQRAQARRDRDWALSDALRKKLAEMGWLAEDTPQGQQLRRV